MFKSIVNFFKSFFGGTGFLSVRSFANTAVQVVNALKNIVASPALDVLTSMTSTSIDNKVLAVVRELLPKIAQQLLIAEKILNSGKNNAEILETLAVYLRGKTPDARAKFYIELAGKITAALADGKISFAESIAISQLVYAESQK